MDEPRLTSAARRHLARHLKACEATRAVLACFKSRALARVAVAVMAAVASRRAVRPGWAAAGMGRG